MDLWRDNGGDPAMLVVLAGRVRSVLDQLRGHDLCCWCVDGPCHADVLLAIANEDKTDDEWAATNCERCGLIEARRSGALTATQADRLLELQRLADMRQQLLAPLPLTRVKEALRALEHSEDKTDG